MTNGELMPDVAAVRALSRLSRRTLGIGRPSLSHLLVDREVVMLRVAPGSPAHRSQR
jgi:hypothetical protein